RGCRREEAVKARQIVQLAHEEVQRDQGHDQDETATERRIGTGDRRLQRVGDQQDEHEVEQGELADLPLAEQTQGDEKRAVDKRRTQDKLPRRDARQERDYSRALPRSHQDQHGRAEKHDPQRREDAADHGQHHLQRGLGASLLRALTALAPHLISLDAEDLADAGAELLGLDDGLHEVVQVLHPAVPTHLVQRLEAWPAEADLAEGLAQEVGKSVLVFVGDACESGVETEARIDADDQQVKRVWQTLLNLGSPSVDLLLEPQDRRVVAEDQADDRRDDQVEDVAEEQPDEQAERREDRGRDEADRHEVFWSQVARPPRHLQPVEHVLASFLRRRAGQQRAKLFYRRPEERLA